MIMSWKKRLGGVLGPASAGGRSDLGVARNQPSLTPNSRNNSPVALLCCLLSLRYLGGLLLKLAR